jgi:hypothetical protein
MVVRVDVRAVSGRGALDRTALRAEAVARGDVTGCAATASGVVASSTATALCMRRDIRSSNHLIGCVGVAASLAVRYMTLNDTERL